MKAMKGEKCKNFIRCGCKATGSRAKFCLPCFKENAAAKGRSGTGNSQAKGVMGNAGNSRAKGVIGNAGNSRRGRKRRAKFALVWLDQILALEKDSKNRKRMTFAELRDVLSSRCGGPDKARL